MQELDVGYMCTLMSRADSKPLQTIAHNQISHLEAQTGSINKIRV